MQSQLTLISTLSSLSIDRCSGRVLVSARFDLQLLNASWLVVPCGTAVPYCEGKPSSAGCAPRIASIGQASATASSPFVVTGDDLPSQRRSILFYGTGTAAIPFRGGTRCVATPLRRTAVVISTGPNTHDCTGTLAYDFGARIAAGIDPTLSAGRFITAQWLVRDPLDPTGFGTTLSDALMFVIGP